MSEKPVKNHFLKQVTILILVALFLGGPLVLLVGNWNADRARINLEQGSTQALALHKESIFGLLDKFRLMTVLVAHQPDTVTYFARHAQNGGEASQVDLQNFAGRLAAMSGANLVRLALPDGKIIAQSSLNDFVGAEINADLRVAALQERLGRATRFSTDGLNTYSFAASVRDDRKIIGIINVDVDLQVLENAWALSENPIFVTDHEGRFIVGNQLAGQLESQYIKSYGMDGENIQIKILAGTKRFLARGKNFPHIGWTLNMLIDQNPALRARTSAMVIAALIVAILVALTFIVLQRRLAFLTKIEDERNVADFLEKTVATRTKELRKSNKKLRLEFDERVAAETALKLAQDSLIQSAKLAAIGQMSTAMAHEYNQPLAAIRSYADNARVFLAQDKPENTDDNLVRIVKMTQRMAQLSKTLKTFARTPRTELAPVVLGQLLEEAILLVSPSAKKKNVTLNLEPLTQTISVMAGHVRLSQVIVNLLSNAIDAVADQHNRQVYLSASEDQKGVTISVEDSGKGVPKAQRHKIFDAFYTSKDVGEGLGLGLSIAYNIVHDLGGKINVRQSDHGGAKFVITLPTPPCQSQNEAEI